MNITGFDYWIDSMTEYQWKIPMLNVETLLIKP